LRRNYYQLISEVHNLFGDDNTTLYSIKKVSEKTQTTWRTARNILYLLNSLGLINRVIIKKREYWHSKISNASKTHACYYCGDKETVLIPCCKGCLDSFNEYITEILTRGEPNGN